MRLILVLVILLILAGMAYIRLAPSDPARWHVDPLAATDPGQGGVHLVPGGPESAPIFATDPAALLAAFDRIALAEPRTRRLAGTPEDGHVTYIARSRWVGFPDYVSVKAVAAEGGATLAILSRLRFGASDLGVNRARVERWLDALQAAQG